MSPCALVVDSDRETRASTVLALEHGGFEATGVESAEAALRLSARGQELDVVLLEVVRGRNRWRMCRRLRAMSPVAIVVLSATRGVDDVVTALELGADDYVTKPFDDAELVARTRAVVRRASVDAFFSPLRYGELVVDPIGFRVDVEGRSVDLTSTEFRLLLELARMPGEVQSRELLLSRVWGYDYLGDSRLVDMAIKRLRSKLGDEAHDPHFIATVRRVGYRFEAQPS